MVLGGICEPTQAFRYLSAKSTEERYTYDWMGSANSSAFGLLPRPSPAITMREIYQYNQQMGITLMGDSCPAVHPALSR